MKITEHHQLQTPHYLCGINNVASFIYIEKLKKVDINPVCKFKKNKTKTLIQERETLRAKIFQLLWISNRTWPDIGFDVSVLSSKLKDATINELQTVNKLINKIQDNQYTLRYQPLDLPFKHLK